MVSVGHGAFELCLPSLGFFLTKLTLRCLFLGHACRMTKVGHGKGQHPLATLCRSHLRCTGPTRHTGRSLRARISHDVSYQYVSASRLVSVGNGGTWPDRSGSTNAYHIFRRPGTNHWWFWFGVPTLTSAVHVQSALVWLVWIVLPTLTTSPIWVRAGH